MKISGNGPRTTCPGKSPEPPLSRRLGRQSGLAGNLCFLSIHRMAYFAPKFCAVWLTSGAWRPMVNIGAASLMALTGPFLD
jgi:hypothetical protein